MEDRCVPAAIFVTSLADGAGNAALVTPTAQGFSAPSLRAAISFANSNPGGNVIDLATPGVYKISIPNVGAVGEDDNQTGDFDILPGGGNLTIANTSGGPVTVSGGGLDRVFDINPNANFDPNNPTPKFIVTMEGFTITDGYAFSPNFTDGNGDAGTGNNPADVSGGAIRDNFNASLTLQNMNISGNISQAAGGGITMENPDFSTPWTLKVVNSTISNNRSGDAGGGINTQGNGRVDITQSVISNNVCENQGAGIWLDTDDVGNVHQSALLTVTQSIISGNVSLAAGNFGGGIGNAGNDQLAAGQTPLPGEIQAVAIIDSTIADNVTVSAGGGYGDQGGQGTLFVQNSTISDNSANDGGGIQADGPSTTILNSTITGNSSQTVGGGIEATAGTVTIDNTIVAQNFAGPANFLGGMSPDVMATVHEGSGDFIGINDGNLTFTTGSSNQVGTPTSPLNPQLGPLQNNGGPAAGIPTATQTVPTEAPLLGSPVIDKGVNLPSLPTTDERGLLRIVNNTVDVGAVEFQPPATMTMVTTSETAQLRYSADIHGPGHGPGARRSRDGHGHVHSRRRGAGERSHQQGCGHVHHHPHARDARVRQSHIDRHLQRRRQLLHQHGHPDPGRARPRHDHDAEPFGNRRLRQVAHPHGNGHPTGDGPCRHGHGHLQRRRHGAGDGSGHKRHGHAHDHPHAGDAHTRYALHLPPPTVATAPLPPARRRPLQSPRRCRS